MVLMKIVARQSIRTTTPAAAARRVENLVVLQADIQLLRHPLKNRRLRQATMEHHLEVRSQHSIQLSPYFFFPHYFPGMPTIEEVCTTFGLTDVELEYTDTDYQNLTTYKLFQQHVRPLLAKENPKVPMSKLMMLVAAKWRDFSLQNPHLQQSSDADSSQQQTEAPSTPVAEPELSSGKSSRSSRAAKETQKVRTI